MKTIKFLHYAKYPVLLFIAFFGILIGGSQNVPRPFAKNDIGGNGAGSTAPHSFAMSTDEIGGSQTAPRSFVMNGATEIGGGQTAPRDPNGYKSDLDNTVGSQASPRSGGMITHKETEPIGGQSVPRNVRGDIGGNSAPRSYAYHCMEIGGGGNETRKLFLASMTDSANEIGGNQGAPRIPLAFFSNENKMPIGGQRVPQPSEPFTVVENVPVKYSVYDFSDSFDIDFEIGGQTTPGSETRQFVSSEIGGGQTAPRQLIDIGGNQTAPRQLEIGGQSVPSSRPFAIAFVDDIGGNGTPRTSGTFIGFPEIGGPGNQGVPRI